MTIKEATDGLGVVVLCRSHGLLVQRRTRGEEDEQGERTHKKKKNREVKKFPPS